MVRSNPLLDYAKAASTGTRGAIQPARPHLPKPPDMFARDWQWSELTAFAADEGPEATMAVVSGRRRQGKSFLLDSIARAAGGFYFCAYEATEAESLRRFGEELG